MMRNQTKSTLYVALLICLLGLTSGCQFLISQPQETPTPVVVVVTATAPPATQPVVPTQAPTESPALTATAPQVPTPTAAQPVTPKSLTDSGPWLLLRGIDRLWGANANGTAVTQLLDEPVLQLAAQPGGNLVAYITGQADTMQNLALKILTLPEGSVQTVTWLTNAETQPDLSSGMLDEKVDAVRAILDLQSLAWSPNGSLLAFIGVQDGPSANLYTYNPASGAVTRLTDGPSQGYGPVWSPDSRYIVHFGVSTFGTGAGYGMSGGWAARADGSGVVTLFTGGGSGQDFAGWLDQTHFLIHSWSPACGPQDLRIQNVVSARQTTIYSGCFNAARAASFSGLALVATTAEGLISINPADGKRTTLDPVSPASLQPIGMYAEILAQGSTGMQVYTGHGERISEAPRIDCDNPLGSDGYGALYAWTCSAGDAGVWVSGPGLDTWQVFDGPAALPAWSPDNTLLFLSENKLYAAYFMAYVPEPVSELPGQVTHVSWAGWE